MNYVALIALLAALAFTLPLLVRLAEAAGLSRGLGVVITLAMGTFTLCWLWLRGRQQRRRLLEERVATIGRQRARAPEDPTAFLEEGDPLGQLLLRLGRRQEAREAFEAHLEVATRAGHDVAELERVLAGLRLEPLRLCHAEAVTEAESPLEDEHASV